MWCLKEWCRDDNGGEKEKTVGPVSRISKEGSLEVLGFELGLWAQTARGRALHRKEKDVK